MEVPFGLVVVLCLIGAVFGSLLTAAAFSWWLLRPKNRIPSDHYFHYRQEPVVYVANWDSVTQQMARRQ